MMQRCEDGDSVVVGLGNGTATPGGSLVCLLEPNTLTTRTSNHTPWYSPTGVEQLHPRKTHA